MSSGSSRLSLPLIAPAQTQKHVTHNEALRLLDVLAQLDVQGFNAQTQPATLTERDTYELCASREGD